VKARSNVTYGAIVVLCAVLAACQPDDGVDFPGSSTLDLAASWVADSVGDATSVTAGTDAALRR